MSKPTIQGERRLAAIMFTDIAGYTAMAQKNEVLAMQLLEEHRILLRPAFQKYNGRVVDVIADAFFVEFASAVDSVNCAVEIQTRLKEDNDNRPNDEKIFVRIGIHLGDVFHNDDRVSGDAVNVASRIYSMALPGGICLTQYVFDNVQNKVDLPIIPFGTHKLKNVESPMNLYAIALPWENEQLHAATQDLMLLQNPTTGKESETLLNVFSSGVETLDKILGGGYPENGSIMVVGPPSVGKEALGYHFIRAGLLKGDCCLYVTHRSVSDIGRGMQAFGIDTDRFVKFIARSGSQKRCDLNDSISISLNIKQVLSSNKEKRVRIVTDVLSPLLLLNPVDAMYRYWTELVQEIKDSKAVLLAFAEEAMHPLQVLASMEQLFDGVIELSIYKQGLLLTPLLHVNKMLGLPPLNSYFRFSFRKTKMEILANVTL